MPPGSSPSRAPRPTTSAGCCSSACPRARRSDFLRQLMAEFRSQRDFKRALEPAPEVRLQQEPAAGVDRGRRHRPRVPRAARGAALAGRRARTRRAGRPAAEHAARPEPPALGVHDHRRAGRQPLRAVHQDAPLADRRRQRHEAAAARRCRPTAAKSLGLPPFWASGSASAGAGRRAPRPTPTVANAAAAAVQALRGQARSVPQLVAAFGKMLKRIGDPGEGMAVPFDAPRSVLNGRVREKRRFATQQFPMERLRALATAAQCTLNDVVLAICGGALRRFLLERDSLPDKTADRRHPGVGAAEGRRRQRQRDQLHRRDAGHRHRRPGRAAAGDQALGAARQGARAEPAARRPCCSTRCC